MELTLTDARLRILAARIVAQNRWPYLSGVLFSLKPVEADHDQVPTLAVDAGWRVYYSPKFVLEHEVEVLATALMHEALHCVLDHVNRYQRIASFQDSSNQIWNLCGDAHINKMLDEAGMPWGSFSPVRFDSLEKYDVSPQDSTEAAHNKVLEHVAKAPEELKDAPDCGSGAGGTRRSYEIEDTDSAAPSLPSADRDSIRDVLAIEVNQRRARGEQIPGELSRWAESRLSPVVDWRKQLGVTLRSSFAVASGKKDYSYTKPSRKQQALNQGGINVVLPSLRNPTPPNIAVVIDTSGSISKAEIERYAGELYGILKSIGSASKLEVIGCDTRVTGPFRIKKASDVKELQLRGGGGTDLRVGIDFALNDLRSEIIIVATDGDTPWHEKCPDSSKTYIGLFTSPKGIEDSPSWILPINVR